jgi:hypothetical protein
VTILGLELATSLVFDVGVLLVVVGAVELTIVAVLRHGSEVADTRPTIDGEVQT